MDLDGSFGYNPCVNGAMENTGALPRSACSTNTTSSTGGSAYPRGSATSSALWDMRRRFRSAGLAQAELFAAIVLDAQRHMTDSFNDEVALATFLEEEADDAGWSQFVDVGRIAWAKRGVERACFFCTTETQFISAQAAVAGPVVAGASWTASQVQFEVSLPPSLPSRLVRIEMNPTKANLGTASSTFIDSSLTTRFRTISPSAAQWAAVNGGANSSVYYRLWVRKSDGTYIAVRSPSSAEIGSIAITTSGTCSVASNTAPEPEAVHSALFLLAAIGGAFAWRVARRRS